jgi:hypothetical protein
VEEELEVSLVMVLAGLELGSAKGSQLGLAVKKTGLSVGVRVLGAVGASDKKLV